MSEPQKDVEITPDFEFYDFEVEPDGIIEPNIGPDGKMIYLDEPCYFLFRGYIVFGIPYWDSK